ncbi:MAG: hypothetical protein KDA24_05065 [Deltaproteobacteria bacterium]|nr:hypothetical protein [Deltaproteobacteria bacterium]
MWTDAIEVGIATFLSSPKEPEEALRDKLARLGVEPWLASRLLLWLPVAFGRAALDDVTFADAYTVDDAPAATLLASEDPIYAAAVERAKTMTRDEAKVIAARSAELTVISNYLTAEEKAGRAAGFTDVPVPQLSLATALPPLGEGDGGVPEPRAFLARFFAAHDLAVAEVPGQGFTCGDLEGDVRVFPKFEQPPLCGQVDYRFSHPRLVADVAIESNAAVGETWKDAIHHSLRNFVQSSLHVIMATLITPELGRDQVAWELWPHHTGSYKACLGAHFFTGGDPVDIGPLVNALRLAFVEEPAERDVHTVRMFTGRKGAKVYGEEVLLDGEPWEAGLHALREFGWPRRDTFYSSRLFLMLTPNER